MKPQPQNDKVLKIGKYKFNYGTLCVFALVIIIGFSSVGYYVSTLVSGEEDIENKNIVQIRAIIYFTNKSIASNFVDIEEGETAETAFKKIANLTTEYGQSGVVITGMQAGNKSAFNNETDYWVFYVNGGVKFDGVDRYTPKYGDTLELRYEHEPF